MHKIQKEQVIGEMAATALRLEAAVTPKPGLVDRENSGAHTDMDYPLFLVSADALKPYFAECAEMGTACGTVCGEQIFSLYAKKLREAGIEAERHMFKATGGVNTHKGMVFSMGILCFCLGYLSEKLNLSTAEIGQQSLQNHCGSLAAILFGEVLKNKDETHGEEVLRKTGIRGIREEALSGFDSAFSLGLSALKRARSMGLSPNDSMVYTLLYLMTEVEDSNVVYRGGTDGLALLQKRAADIIGRDDLTEECWLQMVREFDKECITLNLSAGGCADMLAMSIMLYMIFEDYQWLLN